MLSESKLSKCGLASERAAGNWDSLTHYGSDVAKQP